MKVEVIDGKLVLSPTTADEGRVIFALVAAWSAFESVLYPIMGKAVRYKNGHIPPELDQSAVKSFKDYLHLHCPTVTESVDLERCYDEWLNH